MMTHYKKTVQVTPAAFVTCDLAVPGLTHGTGITD